LPQGAGYPSYATVFNRLGYSPGLSKILSHSELIPDAALTLTLARKRYNEIQSQSKNKKKLVTLSSQEPAVYDSSALTTTLRTPIVRKSVMLMHAK